MTSCTLECRNLAHSPTMASVDRSNAASSSASTTFTRDILEDIIRMQRDVIDRSKAYWHDDSKLSQGELVWRDRYAWLKERGYQLRSRYSPNWKPSWLNKGENESGLGAEDGGAFSYTVSRAATGAAMDASLIEAYCRQATSLMRRASRTGEQWS